MNQQKAKLFRSLFDPTHRQSYRKFKKAYTQAPLEKRLLTIAMAEKIKAKGNIHYMEVPNGQQ